MSMGKQWVAQCDHPGCTTITVLEGKSHWDRWDYGMVLNDEGWWGAPNVDETFCPEHYPEQED